MSEPLGSGQPRGLRLRPLPLSELLDEAIRMYRSEFPIFFLVALVVGLPNLLFNFATGSYKTTGSIFNAIARGAVQTSGSTSPFVSPIDFNPVPLIVVAVATIVAGPFLIGGLTAASVGVAEGRELNFGDVMQRVLNRYWRTWGVVLLEFLAALGLVIVAVVLFLVPVLGLLVGLFGLLPLAIFLFIRWSVALPVIYAEETGSREGLARSWNLVRGHWWRVFGILFLSGILVAILAGALGLALGIVAFVIPGLSGDARGAVSVVAQTVASAAVSPVSAVITTLIYYDLRVRKEAVDLDQLAIGAALPPSQLPPAPAPGVYPPPPPRPPEPPKQPD